MSKLTANERQQIKDWVMHVVQPDLVRKMQDDTIRLERLGMALRDDGFKANRYNEKFSFADQVQAFKAHYSYHPLCKPDDFGLCASLQRGGLTWAYIAQTLSAQVLAGKPPKGGSTLVHAEALLHRGLIEAQTGFFTITADEFAALKKGPAQSDSLCDQGDDHYKTINDTMPRKALEKVNFMQFKQLVVKALREDGLLQHRGVAVSNVLREEAPPATWRGLALRTNGSSAGFESP